MLGPEGVKGVVSLALVVDAHCFRVASVFYVWDSLNPQVVNCISCSTLIKHTVWITRVVSRSITHKAEFSLNH